MKKKPSLLHVPMSEAKKRIANGEEFTAEDWKEWSQMNAKDQIAKKEWQDRFRERVKAVAPWFDFTSYSYARLCGVLSQAYPGEPLSSWMDIPEQELFGYVDAVLIENESDAWVVVPQNDIKFDRSTIKRHIDKYEYNYIRRTEKNGVFEIKQNHLHTYLKTDKLEKYSAL